MNSPPVFKLGYFTRIYNSRIFRFALDIANFFKFFFPTNGGGGGGGVVIAKFWGKKAGVGVALIRDPRVLKLRLQDYSCKPQEPTSSHFHRY